MTPKELADELKRLAEKATPGPWKSGRPDMLSSAVYGDGEVGEMGKYVYRQMDAPVDDVMFGAFHIPEPNSIEDAQLIVSLRNNLPTLLRALSALEAVEGVKGALEAADQFIGNGVEFGYIQMPTMQSDAALKTTGLVKSALATLEAAGL